MPALSFWRLSTTAGMIRAQRPSQYRHQRAPLRSFFGGGSLLMHSKRCYKAENVGRGVMLHEETAYACIGCTVIPGDCVRELGARRDGRRGPCPAGSQDSHETQETGKETGKETQEGQEDPDAIGITSTTNRRDSKRLPLRFVHAHALRTRESFAIPSAVRFSPGRGGRVRSR